VRGKIPIHKKEILYNFVHFNTSRVYGSRNNIFMKVGFLQRIFGSKRNEVTGEWRKLHNEEVNELYTTPNIVRVIKSRRMKWAEHVARMGEERDVYRVLVGKPE
jgi:hypothetical protein